MIVSLGYQSLTVTPLKKKKKRKTQNKISIICRDATVWKALMCHTVLYLQYLLNTYWYNLNEMQTLAAVSGSQTERSAMCIIVLFFMT